MASELRLTTLANNAGTESVDTTYVINGSAKVTGNLQSDGSSNAAVSLNISSVTDTAASQNTVAVTNAFSAALAVAALISNHDGSYNRGHSVDDSSASSFLTRSFTSSSGSLSGTDVAHSIAFFGDLA